MPTLNPGQTLDRYQIVAFLANGGMGEVYHARHLFMDRDVALKLVFPHLIADAAMAERFQREVRSVTSLAHEHIVKVYDAGVADGHHFMAMEYLAGGSLASEMRSIREAGEKMPVARAIEITRQIALALDYAHKAGFSHRDVKPGNVLKRSANVYVLTDFGLVLDEAASRLTNTGWGMGTPAYMPPEQWNGQAVPQSDIYALGVTLFEMLTGTAPFSATSPSALMIKHMTEPPPRVLSARQDSPAWLQNVLDVALAKAPADRFQSGEQFAVALASEGTHAGVRTKSRAAKQGVTNGGGLALGTTAPKRGLAVSRRGILSVVGGVGIVGLTGVALSSLLSGASTGAQAPSPQPPAGSSPAPTSPQPTSTVTAPAATVTPAPPAVNVLNQGNRRTIQVADILEMDFVQIYPGQLSMGEGTSQHQQVVPGFWMARTHATVAQFLAFVRATSYDFPSMPGLAAKADHPIVNVSWNDAVAFCSWLSKVVGKTVRLPTEAEWERAARNGDGRRFPWGYNEPDPEHANYENASRGTTPVGKYSPAGDSAYGCADMAGNAWQWVNSLYMPYPYDAKDGREDPLAPGLRVLRGGSFSSSRTRIGCATRSYFDPGARSAEDGFRVCVTEL